MSGFLLPEEDAWQTQEANHSMPDEGVNQTDNTVNYIPFSQRGLEAQATWHIVLQACTLAVILISSILINCVVFVVFYRKPLLLTISNRFVLNLAASNFGLSVIVMPQSLAASITDEWVLGEIWCQIVGMVTTLLSAACITTLLLIAMDRFYAIMKPLHYGMCLTAHRASWLLAAVWLFSTLMAVPPLVGWNKYVYQRPFRICGVDWADRSLLGRSYTYTLVLVCFVVPFTVMCWVYVTAFQQAKLTIAKARRNSVTADHNVDLTVAQQAILHNQNRRRSSTVSLFQIVVNSPLRRRSTSSSLGTSISSRRSLTANMGDDWKAAKTGFICMSTFTLCWLPFFVLITCLASINEPGIPVWVATSSMWVAFISCTLNPLVYVFRNHSIRRHVANMLLGRERVNESARSSIIGGSLKDNRANRRSIITSCPHSYPQMTSLINNDQISRTSSVVTFHTVDTRNGPLL